MEELLQQILSAIQELNKDMSTVKDRLSVLEAEMATKSQLSAVEAEMVIKMSTLAAEMATKSQQDENSAFIQALLHRTEETDAKLDNLLLNTASKESIADLDAKFDVLNKRLFQQEAELLRLKKAQ